MGGKVGIEGRDEGEGRGRELSSFSHQQILDSPLLLL